MGGDRPVDPGGETWWSATQGGHACRSERVVLPTTHGVPMAVLAQRVPFVVDGVVVFLALAPSGDLGGVAYPVTRSLAHTGRTPCDSQRRHHRQSIGEDDAKRGARGYDGGKKVKGRKRHILVDTQGLLLKVLVHTANIQDRDGAQLLLADLPQRFPRLSHLWADAGYRGKCVTWVQETLGWSMEIVKHWWTGRTGFWVGPGQEPPVIPAGFVPLPRRWVVERTFAWLTTNRRLVVEYDALPSSSEARVYLAMIRLMTKRLATAT